MKRTANKGTLLGACFREKSQCRSPLLRQDSLNRSFHVRKVALGFVERIFDAGKAERQIGVSRCLSLAFSNPSQLRFERAERRRDVQLR